MLKVKRSQAAFFYIQVVILGWLSLPSTAFCQNSMIDSLKYLLITSKEDSERVDILTDLSAEYIDSFKLDEAKQFANEALLLSQTIGYKIGESIALVNLGNAFSDEENSDEALKCYEQALSIRQVLNMKKGMAECYNNIGLVLWSKSQFAEALKNHTLALSIREEIKDTIGMAFSYQNIGNVFIEMGSYPNAVENYLKALSVFEKKGIKYRVADNYNNLGTVYWHQKDYHESIYSFQRSLEILKELNNKERTSNTLSNIGNIYFVQNNFPEALKYYNLALSVQREYKDIRGISNSYLNIGAAYQKQNYHDEALKYFFQSLSFAETQKNQDGISAAQLNIGISYRSQNKYFLARDYINKGLEISKEIEMIERTRDSYQELAVLDSIQGRWKEAFNNYKMYTFYRDSLLNEKNTIETVQLREGYKYDKKKELDKLIHENELATLNDRAKNQQIIWITMFLATLIIGFFGISYWRKRAYYRFEQKISDVKQEALNAQMSGHFISNTVDSIMGFIESNDKKKAIDYLLLFHRLIRRVLENSFQKLVPLESEFGVLKDYFELERLRFKENSLSLELNIDDEIDAQNTLIPPMIFQTLVENSIKHAFKKSQGGVIKVFIKENLKSLECAVEDNGIGRSAAELARSGEDYGKTSYGSSLAEKLVSVAGGPKGETSYQVIDLVDPDGAAKGTRTEFGVLKILN